MTRSEAAQLASEQLGKDKAILQSQTLERWWGWMFFYQSDAHVESGRPEDLLFGNAPIMVDRRTGEVRFAGTRWSPRLYAAGFAVRSLIFRILPG